MCQMEIPINANCRQVSYNANGLSIWKRQQLDVSLRFPKIEGKLRILHDGDA